MQNNAGLNIEMLTSSNVSSFVQCVLELIANSLTAHSTAIAIRIHAGKHEIHVIDNGIGIPKDMLEHIAKYDPKTISNKQQIYELNKSNGHTLTNICSLSDRLTIASRYQYSKETFMKIFKVGFAPNLAQIEQRPLCGTTVSVYVFHEIGLNKKWDMSTICFFVAAIAVTKLKVSFSIRDKERRKVVLRIAKPHSPIEVLKVLLGKNLPLNHTWLIQCNTECNTNYHGYIGLSNKNAMQWIFLNHRPICCPLILKLIKVVFRERINLPFDQENMFILFFLTFPQNEFTFVTENEKRYIMFYDMQKILNSIKNCAFKCLAKEITVTPYLYETQILKRTYLKSERSIFNNNINGHNKNVTSLMKKNKIVMIGLKRRKITSTIVTNYSDTQHNRSNNIKDINCNIKKRNSILNSIQHQIDIASTKHVYSCEDKVTEKIYNNVDKTLTNLINSTITNDSTESDKNYSYNDDNNFMNMISPLSEWSNWTYHTNNKKHNSMRSAHETFSKNDIFSQQFFKYTNKFNFLPRKLYGLLQYRHATLTNIKCFNSPINTISFKENWQHDQTTVHPCNLKQKLYEFRLSRASLECIKIINQVNNEFIAAWMMYDDVKILLMIDQHAVHERIRYENLLLTYKAQNEDELLSINLRDPLAVKFPTKIYNLLLHNKMLLKKYGISLGSLKENTLLIRTIPQCLVTSTDHCNREKILTKIYGLLNDILKNYSTTNHANTLPLTIHNAIASEACHGAIKFGDNLTFEQCTYLMKLLKYTKSPNRCAHGRPTIIPVMELSELEKRGARILEKKLNFASLKEHY